MLTGVGVLVAEANASFLQGEDSAVAQHKCQSRALSGLYVAAGRAVPSAVRDPRRAASSERFEVERHTTACPHPPLGHPDPILSPRTGPCQRKPGHPSGTGTCDPRGVKVCGGAAIVAAAAVDLLSLGARVRM